MKTRTKITVTLAVGISLLIGSMGTASAKPHYTDWTTGVKAPVTSFESAKLVNEKASPGEVNEVRANVKRSRISFNDVVRDSDVVNDIKNSNLYVAGDEGRSDGIWTTGGTASLHSGLGLHDSVHCLSNIKSAVSIKRGLGLHDSVHCLHNNGAFLPLNSIQFMKFR
ncbi:MAG: hypothetical protein CL504_08720 [Actinobacteria bacterium]|nr:hypothetical protein [Actinomycetota bacterium]|tara:strand:+ start:65 stop:565 length:501 start_codon:yes stop_codon:yes gene_type:complete